ncbi:MAG: site-specific integrase [Pirellulales bacterium]|nr:site-specific integrase [Pirellulales bacterium]
MNRPVYLEDVLVLYLDSHWSLCQSYRNDLMRSVRYLSNWSGTSPMPLEMLSESLLGRWLRHYAETHTPASVNNRRRHLLTLWRYAAEELSIIAMPRKIPKIQEPKKIPECWTLEECERIFAAAKQQTGWIGGIPAGQWWLSLLLVVYWTGERIGAVRHVRPEDYDVQRMALRIRPENQKTRRERLFFLPPEIHQKIMVVYDTDREFLWPFDYHPTKLWLIFRRLLKCAGIEHDTRKPMNLFHRLRRTSGTLCEMNGGDGARHLGHSRAIFEKHYFSPGLAANWKLECVPVPAF